MKLIKFNGNFNSESHLFYKTQESVDAFYKVLDIAFSKVPYITVYRGQFAIDDVDKNFRNILQEEEMDSNKYEEVQGYMSEDYHMESLLESCFKYLSKEDSELLLPLLGYNI